MRILFVAPKCFPVDGAESIVNIKLLQAFAKCEDITVDVVSRQHNFEVYPSDEIQRYNVRVDELRIVRSENKLNIRTAWQTMMCFLVFHSAFKGCVWAYKTLPVVNELMKKHRYDFVLTKSSPSFLIGSYLHKKGLPWIASWNDPFPVGFYPAPYGKDSDHKSSLIEKMMLKQMNKADFHVYPSQKLQDHMLSYMHVARTRCCVIPHAVIPDNSQEHRVRIASVENDYTMRIIHSGNLSAPRDPTTFFTAMDHVIQQHPEYRITVAVLGRVAEDVLPNDNRFPNLHRCLTVVPPLEYNKALQKLTEYDLACVIEANTKVGKAVFLPTKVTDFMQMSIPIMSVSPREGVLHDMYRNGNIGYFSDVTDIKSIEQEIIRAYHDFCSTGLKNNVVDNSFLPEGIVGSYRIIADKLASY